MFYGATSTAEVLPGAVCSAQDLSAIDYIGHSSGRVFNYKSGTGAQTVICPLINRMHNWGDVDSLQIVVYDNSTNSIACRPWFKGADGSSSYGPYKYSGAGGSSTGKFTLSWNDSEVQPVYDSMWYVQCAIPDNSGAGASSIELILYHQSN